MRHIPTKLSRPVQSPMQSNTGPCATGVCRPVVHSAKNGTVRPMVHAGRDRSCCPPQRGMLRPSTERGTQCSLALPATLAPAASAGGASGPLGSVLDSQQGQALYEYILALPIFALLLLFVGVFAWYWWNQSVAAVAIHDGVRAAAVYGGSPEDGLAVVEERLYAPLGAVASASYDGHYSIVSSPQFRSVYGTIDKGALVHITFLNRSNPLLFRVRAFSFQRDWAFYGGPGNGWD